MVRQSSNARWFKLFAALILHGYGYWHSPNLAGMSRSRRGRRSGRVQIYRNGDVCVHAVASEALDTALSALRGFSDFRLPNTPADYGEYVQFKFEIIAYVYKKWARRQIVAHPIDVFVLEAPEPAVEPSN